MARVAIENNNVQVQLSGADKFWGFHGSLQIPLSHVTQARVEDENGWVHMWRKIAGTAVPGVKMAGTFFMEGGLAFVDYEDGRSCLVLQTQHERYRVVIVQPDRDQDPDALAAEINRRVGHT